jgi:hypothetical protein
MSDRILTIISESETEDMFWIDLPGDPRDGLYENLFVEVAEGHGVRLGIQGESTGDDSTLRKRAAEELLKLERRIGRARLRVLAEELTRSLIRVGPMVNKDSVDFG